MKKTFITLLIAALLAFTGCAAGAGDSVKPNGKDDMNNTENTPAPAYTSITMDEAAELMNSEEGYILLDVRTFDEYHQGHIPGAICVPNESIGGGDVPELPDKEQLILVYCRSGNRSKQASQKLAALGYTNVVEIGGIIDWSGDIVTEE